jgi:hypothetical protein
MLTRCTNKNSSSYENYGGRGITVCDRWLNSFELFFEDVGHRLSLKHSIERINTNGNYEPNNVKWATSREQSRNKRNNRWIEYNGKRMIITDWASYFGVHHMTIVHMIKLKGEQVAMEFFNKKYK